MLSYINSGGQLQVSDRRLVFLKVIKLLLSTRYITFLLLKLKINTLLLKLL